MWIFHLQSKSRLAIASIDAVMFIDTGHEVEIHSLISNKILRFLSIALSANTVLLFTPKNLRGRGEGDRKCVFLSIKPRWNFNDWSSCATLCMHSVCAINQVPTCSPNFLQPPQNATCLASVHLPKKSEARRPRRATINSIDFRRGPLAKYNGSFVREDV